MKRHLARESSATIFTDLNEIFLKVNTCWLTSYTSQLVLVYCFSTFVLINAPIPLKQRLEFSCAHFICSDIWNILPCFFIFFLF